MPTPAPTCRASENDRSSGRRCRTVHSFGNSPYSHAQTRASVMMKKFTFRLFLVAPLALLWFAACDDTSLVKKHPDGGASLDAGVAAKPKPVPGVCAPKKCPQPKAP